MDPERSSWRSLPQEPQGASGDGQSRLRAAHCLAEHRRRSGSRSAGVRRRTPAASQRAAHDVAGTRCNGTCRGARDDVESSGIGGERQPTRERIALEPARRAPAQRCPRRPRRPFERPQRPRRLLRRASSSARARQQWRRLQAAAAAAESQRLSAADRIGDTPPAAGCRGGAPSEVQSARSGGPSQQQLHPRLERAEEDC